MSTDVSPLTWEGKYHALREAYNRNRASLLDAEDKITALRDLLKAIHEAMELPHGQQEEDATDVVHAVLDGNDWADTGAQARWLRKEVAAIRDGGGTAALARRTIAEMTVDDAAVSD